MKRQGWIHAPLRLELQISLFAQFCAALNSNIWTHAKFQTSFSHLVFIITASHFFLLSVAPAGQAIDAFTLSSLLKPKALAIFSYSRLLLVSLFHFSPEVSAYVIDQSACRLSAFQGPVLC